MDYRFLAQESLGSGVRRMAAELLGCVLEAVRVPAGARPDAEAVHSARKALKKLRSLLRLVRKPLGRETFRREVAFCRDTAHLLSSTRDADVRLATFDGLVHFQSRFSAESVERIRQLLSGSGASSHGHEATLDAAGFKKICAAIEAAQTRFEALGEFDQSVGKILRKGLDRSYRRARKAFKATFSAPEPDSLHDCRKRFKDLQYQLELLSCGESSGPIAKAERAAKYVAEGLGEDRDLTLLGEYLRGRAREKIDAAEVARLQGKIGRRREDLQEKARKIGGRLLESESDAFVKRIGRRWKKAQKNG